MGIERCVGGTGRRFQCRDRPTTTTDSSGAFGFSVHRVWRLSTWRCRFISDPERRARRQSLVNGTASVRDDSFHRQRRDRQRLTLSTIDNIVVTRATTRTDRRAVPTNLAGPAGRVTSWIPTTTTMTVRRSNGHEGVGGLTPMARPSRTTDSLGNYRSRSGWHLRDSPIRTAAAASRWSTKSRSGRRITTAMRSATIHAVDDRQHTRQSSPAATTRRTTIAGAEKPAGPAVGRYSHGCNDNDVDDGSGRSTWASEAVSELDDANGPTRSRPRPTAWATTVTV